MPLLLSSHRFTRDCFWMLVAGWLISTVASAAEIGDELDRRMLDILKVKCAICHDDQKQSAGAGVNNLLKLDELASGYGNPRDPEKSPLFELISGSSPRMPKPRLNANVTWNGALDEAEKQTILAWLRRGGPSSEYRDSLVSRRDLITDSQLFEVVAKDLQGLEGEARANARYLTLTNLHNQRSVSNAELELLRKGLVKLLNSLSRSADVLGLDTSSAAHKLAALDDARSIFRLDLRHLKWTTSEWDRVTQFYPFAFNFNKPRSEAERTVTSLTPSPVPILRGDWFAFVTTQPPLYHELAGIPTTLSQLERELGVNRLEAIRQRKVRRAGFGKSFVSDSNRVLERIPLTTRPGALHLSYDFGSDIGRQNIKEHPLGPDGVFETPFAFRHDGGEIIYPLPNGFLGFLLVTAAGDRIDVAPPIVKDPAMPFGGRIINGISCLSCHVQGMKPEADQAGILRISRLDEVREAARPNTRRFSAAERDLIHELYPEPDEFASLLSIDRRGYQQALTAAGLDPKETKEPIYALFERFARDLDLDTVAAELGLSPEDCRERLEKDSETRQILLRIERQTLRRSVFLNDFRTIARLAGIGDVRDHQPQPLPYFGELAPTVTAAVTPPDSAEKTPVAKPVTSLPATVSTTATGIDLLDAEQQVGQLQVTLRTERDQRHFNDGDVIRCHIRANQDCFLTVVAVDPSGDINLLLPNEFQQDFRLTAGQTVTIPTASTKFKFVAAAPHGSTVLKVIATKRALALLGASAEQLKGQGIATLGNVKAIVVRSNASDPNLPRPQLTFRKLDEQFAPNEWATANLTLLTRSSAE